MAPELGHPLIDDKYERSLHPLVGLVLHRYLSRFEGIDDNDDEMRHLYTGWSDTRCLACSILETERLSKLKVRMTRQARCQAHIQKRREQFSTPHTARDPKKIDEIKLENEDLQGMIHQPSRVGTVRFHHETKSTDVSHAGVNSNHIPGHYLDHHR